MCVNTIQYSVFNAFDIYRQYAEFGCDDLSSLSAVAKLNDNYHPDVFLGPECSTGKPF